MKRPLLQPKIIIIAGPNGAGKTTFARQFLPQEAGCPDYINLDLIAQGLSPFAPEKAALRAGRIMLAEIGSRVKLRQSFAFESTLSGLNYARHIQRWKALGYHVKIVFLTLPTVKMAERRVKARVALGGHNVPVAVIRRRFRAGMKNFQKIYRGLADSWLLYDNRGARPVLLAEGGLP